MSARADLCGGRSAMGSSLPRPHGPVLRVNALLQHLCPRCRHLRARQELVGTPLEDATLRVGPGISAWLRTSIGCSLGAVTVPSCPLTRHRSGKTLWVLEGYLGRG